MPQSLRPAESFDVVLSGDAHLPANEQPWFRFRPLNGLQWRQSLPLLGKLKSLDETDADSTATAISSIYELLRLGLIAWGNMRDGDKAIAYDPARLEELVNPIEAQELISKMFAGPQATRQPSTKKNRKAARLNG